MPILSYHCVGSESSILNQDVGDTMWRAECKNFSGEDVVERCELENSFNLPSRVRDLSLGSEREIVYISFPSSSSDHHQTRTLNSNTRTTTRTTNLSSKPTKYHPPCISQQPHLLPLPQSLRQQISLCTQIPDAFPIHPTGLPTLGLAAILQPELAVASLPVLHP